MKIFRGNCDVIILVLNDVLNEKKHLGKTLDFYLHSNKKLGARDRNFIAENVFDSIRFLRYFAYLSNQDLSTQRFNTTALFAAKLLSISIELPDWFAITPEEKASIESRLQEKIEHKIKSSFTDWFYQEGEQNYSAKWELVADQLNQQAQVCLRVNRLKTSREELVAQFQKENIELIPSDICSDGLILKLRQKLVNHPSYLSGCFEFQDISSQQVVEFCDARPNTLIIDTCAGAGGKSLHLASILQNKGQIISLDIHKNKVAELAKRAVRAGAKMIEARIADDMISKEFEGQADLVLIDSPCSGSGVIKRNPENKWQLTESFVSHMSSYQKDILNNYAELVKPGGTLVYATCSILRQENQMQIAQFLEDHTNFTFVEEHQLVPGINTDFDGFYMAKLIKKKT